MTSMWREVRGTACRQPGSQGSSPSSAALRPQSKQHQPSEATFPELPLLLVETKYTTKYEPFLQAQPQDSGPPKEIGWEPHFNFYPSSRYFLKENV